MVLSQDPSMGVVKSLIRATNLKEWAELEDPLPRGLLGADYDSGTSVPLYVGLSRGLSECDDMELASSRPRDPREYKADASMSFMT